MLLFNKTSASAEVFFCLKSKIYIYLVSILILDQLIISNLDIYTQA